MSSPAVPAPRRLELLTADTGRASSLVCRGALDARGAPRLERAIDAALARSSVLVYLDLEDVTSVDATGARLVAAAIRRCTCERVHLELWPGVAGRRMLSAMGVRLPRQAHPSRPCALAGGLGVASAVQDSGRHPVWAIPPTARRASMGP
jgi:anti-anti-sigma factor